MADINIGSIYADLDIRTGNLDRGLARAREAMDACDREVKQLAEDLKQGAINAADHTARMAALNATMAGLTTRMNAAYSATTTLNTGLEILNKKSGDMVRQSSRMATGLMQLGYIADDVQYGFSGVVNNIAPLTYGLGGSAGLASAVQVTAVAAHQLYIHLDDLKDALGVSPVRTEAEEMERLAKATSRTAEETDKLNAYKKQQADIAKMLGGQSQQAGEIEKAVQDVYNEAGPTRVSGALAAKMLAPNTPEQQARIDAAQAGVDKAKRGEGETVEMVGLDGNSSTVRLEADVEGAEAKLQNVIDEVNKERNKEAGDRAGKLMDAAKLPGPEGEQARRSIQTKFSDPNHPMHNIASSLEGIAPGAMDAAVDQFKQTERPKRAQEQEQTDAKTLGRRAYLQKKVEEGRNTPEEFQELVKLDKEAKEKEKKAAAAKERADRASRQRAVGRLQFLDEQAGQRKLTDNEQDERTRLRKEADDKDGRKAAQVQREALATGMKAAPGGTKELAEKLTLDVLEGVINPNAARKILADRLKGNGATEMESELGSGRIMGDAAKKVEGDFYKRMLNGREQATSRVFDANNLASTFQSSVGGAKSKELSELEMMRKTLDKLVQQGAIKFARKK